VEAELDALRAMVSRVEIALAEDRATVRSATGQWAAVRAASMQWPEQLSHIRVQLDHLEEQVRADEGQVRDELEGLQHDIGRLSAYTLQTQVQERMINRVEDQQARLADSIAAVSRALEDERLRTNGVIIAGAAVALISTTALLLANAPRFW
jgi:predicted metal-dependent hydrolase